MREYAFRQIYIDTKIQLKQQPFCLETSMNTHLHVGVPQLGPLIRDARTHTHTRSEIVLVVPSTLQVVFTRPGKK